MIEIKKFKDIPWKEVSYECHWYSIFKVDNHDIFVPKEDNMANYRESLSAAYRFAKTKQETKECDGYKIVIEFGEAAGQQISWPHIHVIPCKEKKKRIKETT